jgi:hypothetical protein
VIKVESGDRALERARDAGYSCTILDVMLLVATDSTS